MKPADTKLVDTKPVDTKRFDAKPADRKSAEMKPVYLHAIGLSAPGLPSWTQGRDVLAGHSPWQAQSLPAHPSSILQGNERRRAPPAVLQAFRAAEDARTRTSRDFAALASIFATSDSDLSVMDRINRALQTPARAVSPTDFHNSVHNVAGGYWSIALGCRAVSTTVGGFRGAFAAGLLEAATLALDGVGTLLVAFDVPPPPLLRQRSCVDVAASVALLIDAECTESAQARLHLALTDDAETPMPDAELEVLRQANPALRSLPLLCAVARQTTATVVLPYCADTHLRVFVEPLAGPVRAPVQAFMQGAL